MSEGGRSADGWVERIRHWLWLDRTQRTDNSEANRGFYTSRKPVGWRFGLAMLVIGIVIALVILVVRGAAAQATEADQRIVVEEPGFAVVLVEAIVESG